MKTWINFKLMAHFLYFVVFQCPQVSVELLQDIFLGLQAAEKEQSEKFLITSRPKPQSKHHASSFPGSGDVT